MRLLGCYLDHAGKWDELVDGVDLCDARRSSLWFWACRSTGQSAVLLVNQVLESKTITGGIGKRIKDARKGKCI